MPIQSLRLNYFSHRIVTHLCVIRIGFLEGGGVDMKGETTHSSPQALQKSWLHPADSWLSLYTRQHHQEST